MINGLARESENAHAFDYVWARGDVFDLTYAYNASRENRFPVHAAKTKANSSFCNNKNSTLCL